jgi:hypothetical protein
VLDIGGRQHYLIGRQRAFFVADANHDISFKDEIDLIRAGVRVSLLLLRRFQAIDIGEHPIGLEQIHLLHLFG